MNLELKTMLFICFILVVLMEFMFNISQNNQQQRLWAKQLELNEAIINAIGQSKGIVR